MLAASRNLFGNVSLIKHMRMARFSFAIPLVRVIYFVLIGVFILLCFIAFLVLCFIDVLLRRNNKQIYACFVHVHYDQRNVVAESSVIGHRKPRKLCKMYGTRY